MVAFWIAIIGAPPPIDRDQFQFRLSSLRRSVFPLNFHAPPAHSSIS